MMVRLHRPYERVESIHTRMEFNDARSLLEQTDQDNSLIDAFGMRFVVEF
jgi:hypothetical protein